MPCSTRTISDSHLLHSSAVSAANVMDLRVEDSGKEEGARTASLFCQWRDACASQSVCLSASVCVYLCVCESVCVCVLCLYLCALAVCTSVRILKHASEACVWISRYHIEKCMLARREGTLMYRVGLNLNTKTHTHLVVEKCQDKGVVFVGFWVRCQLRCSRRANVRVWLRLSETTASR
jgi:hypothetical protein